MEEGKEILNCTVGAQGISVCVGNGIQCLHRTFQVWLSIVNTTQDYNIKFYMLHASGFRGQEINAASSINIPFCEMQVTNKESGYIGNNGRVRNLKCS